MIVSLSDERLSWPGTVSVEHAAEYVRPWRIPFDIRGLYQEGLRWTAATGAGARVAFSSDTTSVTTVAFVPEGLVKYDLTVDGELVGTAEAEDGDTISFTDLPAGEKRIELWFGPAPSSGLRSLELSDGASLGSFVDERPKWITYGSSITHCGAAASPVFTWPAVAARLAGFNHTNLGFGGQCHLDPLIATVMRDLPADYLSMCVGINIMGGGTLNLRTFGPGIVGFVRIVREKHPDTPYIVMSPIHNPPRESAPNAAGMTLQIMREEAEAAVEALRDHGDANIHYVNGLDIMGSDELHHLPDELHPDADGYKAMGKRFYENAAKPVFLGAK